MPKPSHSDLKEFLQFAFTAVNAGIRASEDGKFSIEDITYFLGALTLAQPAIDGFAKIPAQIVALTDEDKAELFGFIADEFDLPSDDIEPYVENIVIHTIGMIHNIGNLVQKVQSKGAARS